MDSTFVLELFGRNFNVKEPTAGDMMLIEAKKTAFSNGAYGLMIQSNSLSSNLVLDLVDAIAHLSVLVPTLKQFVNEDQDFNKLTSKQSIQLIVAYRKQFYPWWDEYISDMMKEYKELINELAELNELGNEKTEE